MVLTAVRAAADYPPARDHLREGAIGASSSMRGMMSNNRMRNKNDAQAAHAPGWNAMDAEDGSRPIAARGGRRAITVGTRDK